MNQFIYHQVGQGLFYSGIIGSDFNFVYDCGAKKVNSKSRKVAILKYKINNTAKKINILFISHFHEDHINGITELIKGYGIDYIIMPYLTIYQRLIFLTSNSSKNYKKFIQNPIKYICGKNTKTKIILIKDTDTSISKEKNYNNTNLDNILKDNDKIKDGDDFYYDDEFFKNDTFIKEKTNFTFTQNNWIFDVFYKQLSNKTILKKIKRIGTPQQIIENKNKEIQKIQNILKKNKQDPNENSLILYHGPINIEENKAQLLTGDYSMKKNYGYLKSHFDKTFLHSIQCCSVPHHGGEDSWNKNIIEDLKNCNHYICSYGFLNQYNHPSTKVVYDISRKNRYFITCDQFTEVIINY